MSKWRGWIISILVVGAALYVLLFTQGCDPTPPMPTTMPEEEKPIKSFSELMGEMKELRQEVERIKELQRQYHKGTLKEA